MKKVFSILIGLALLLSDNVYAETTTGGYPACVSEDLFNQYVTAETNNDLRLKEYLLKNGCFIMKSGISVSILEESWGRVKIRAYNGDESGVLWTFIENIH